jgi:flagellar hook-associated protein 2
MATISTAGIGSGLDIPNLVDQLIDVERAPAKERFDRQEATLQAKLSSFGTLKSALSTFQSSFSKLKFNSTFTQIKTTSSDSEKVEVSNSGKVEPGSYSLEVSQLAQAQSLSSAAFDSTSDPVGVGTLTFDFGSYDAENNMFTANPNKAAQSIVISEDNNSLEGVRNAINEAEIGVTASIVNDGTGFVLLLSSDDTGAKNSMKLTVTGDTDGNNSDNTGLSALAYDPEADVDDGKNMAETQAAKDSIFSINGLAMTRESNEVEDAISNVNFNLLDVTTTSVKITIDNDDEQILESINEMVGGFNGMIDVFNALTSYDPETERAGLLLGDSTVRSIETQMRRALSASVTDANGQRISLSNIGITTGRDGKMVLDNSKLETALAEDRETVSMLFNSRGNASDPFVKFATASANTEPGRYLVTVDQMPTQGLFSGNPIPSFPLTIDSSNDDFSITVDQLEPKSFTLDPATYNSGEELATALQTLINSNSSIKSSGGITVSFATDHLEFTSNRKGGNSAVAFSNVESTAFGLFDGEGVAGLDISGSIGSQQATGKDSLLTGKGAADGLTIEITDGLAGNRGTVAFNKGLANELDQLLSRYLNTGSVLDSRTDGLNDRIDDINDQRKKLDNRLVALESRLLKQFTAMDALVGQLQATSSFLDQQLQSLPTLNNKK